MILTMPFGENIKRIRKTWGISQDELAFLLGNGVSRGMIMQWENRGSIPNNEGIINTLCTWLVLKPEQLTKKMVPQAEIGPMLTEVSGRLKQFRLHPEQIETPKLNYNMEKLVNSIAEAVRTNAKLAEEVIQANSFIRSYLAQNNIQAKRGLG